MLLTVVLIVVALNLTVYILGPVAVYFMQKMPTQQEFFRLTDEEIRASTAPDFAERARA